ncbi:uncharacterized protein BO72DRAFT_80170 [Aspergillus fijiensis CBS 313.89]|uniref:Uncharacterized protein n=1 Tax=Aspergillus fijiensis CBS 313.89 TaxID=1448319 RepID=A0A8G1RU11_9EURO|nr:uncharacterized protein BO72DRAFT_80170 [Aspergillus fijiensis CBS 313.89]RAK78293.1 hypothetical protein BO72DRAFT_80170 [Aspergillus fijiensis CBS 313.89]
MSCVGLGPSLLILPSLPLSHCRSDNNNNNNSLALYLVLLFPPPTQTRGKGASYLSSFCGVEIHLESNDPNRLTFSAVMQKRTQARITKEVAVFRTIDLPPTHQRLRPSRSLRFLNPFESSQL